MAISAASQAMRPGAWVPLKKANQVWGERARGPGGKELCSGLQRRRFPGWTIAHVQLKPVQETNLHFILLVGPFFFQTVIQVHEEQSILGQK